MTIDPKQTIAGCSVIRIRALLRRYRNFRFDLEKTVRFLEVNKSQAAKVLQWLESRKYIQLVDSSDQRWWTGTHQAGAFANASARRRITRATADRLLGELLERASEINRKQEFAYGIDWVAVWGSYLGNQTSLGDIDVSVKLKPIGENVQAQRELEAKRIKAAWASGRLPPSQLGQLYWPQEEVFRFLKGRSPSFHFVAHEDEIFLSAPKRILFEATP